MPFVNFAAIAAIASRRSSSLVTANASRGAATATSTTLSDGGGAKGVGGARWPTGRGAVLRALFVDAVATVVDDDDDDDDVAAALARARRSSCCTRFSLASSLRRRSRSLNSEFCLQFDTKRILTIQTYNKK